MEQKKNIAGIRPNSIDFLDKELHDTEYLQYYKKHCCSLNFRTFSDIKDQVLLYMKDEKCPCDIKIMFGDWFFRKLYMNYKPSNSLKKDICNTLNISIDECRQLVLKAEYLKFHDVIAMSMIALYFYKNRFSNQEMCFVLQMLNDTQLIKNYLQEPDTEPEKLKEHFIKWIGEAEIYEQKSNLLDVLLIYFPKDERVIKIHSSMSEGKDLCNDKQNVHDKEIQSSVITAAENLLDWFSEKDRLHGEDESPMKWAEYILKSWYIERDLTVALGVTERIKIDITSFKGKKYTFTIFDIFVATMHYIMYSSDKNTLKNILLDEMKEMLELCSSGYVARFISVLQGYDEKFMITISPEKQLKTVISYIMSKSMSNASENVINGMIDEEYKSYYADFVTQIINKELPRLMKDYNEQDVVMFLPDVVKQMTMLECKLKNVKDKWIFLVL